MVVNFILDYNVKHKFKYKIINIVCSVTKLLFVARVRIDF